MEIRAGRAAHIFQWSCQGIDGLRPLLPAPAFSFDDSSPPWAVCCAAFPRRSGGRRVVLRHHPIPNGAEEIRSRGSHYEIAAFKQKNGFHPQAGEPSVFRLDRDRLMPRHTSFVAPPPFRGKTRMGAGGRRQGQWVVSLTHWNKPKRTRIGRANIGHRITT